MDLFTFVAALIIIMLAMQYNLYWLVLILGAVIVYMAKDMKTFIIVLVVIFVLYIIKGTAYEGYSIYVLALALVVHLALNRGEEESDTFNPNDAYADLLKGLGG